MKSKMYSLLMGCTLAVTFGALPGCIAGSSEEEPDVQVEEDTEAFAVDCAGNPPSRHNWKVKVDPTVWREGAARLENSHERRFHEWRNTVSDCDIGPYDAARMIGDSRPERLRGRDNLHSFRLSQEHRVYFSLDENQHVVTVKKVGSHNPP